MDEFDQENNREPCSYMFSNGTEYEIFLDMYCFKCKRFRNWHCKTVWAMEKARFEGEKAFPFSDLEQDKRMHWKYCKRFTEEPILRARRRMKKPLPGQKKIMEQEG